MVVEGSTYGYEVKGAIDTSYNGRVLEYWQVMELNMTDYIQLQTGPEAMRPRRVPTCAAPELGVCEEKRPVITSRNVRDSPRV
jgi:hypothetical protein